MCLPQTEAKPNEGSEDPSTIPRASQVEALEADEPAKYVKYSLAAIYAAFILYAYVLGPGSLTEAGQFGMVLSGKLDEVNDLFLASFGVIGAVGANLAVLLDAGATRQTKLPTRLFSFLGVLLGFTVLGPYLIARDYAPKVSAEEVRKNGFVSRLLESPLSSVPTLLFTLWCYSFALGVFTPGSDQFHNVVFYATRQDLARLISTERGVSTTMLDLLILSIVTWGPLTEDMTRRGWFKKGEWLESVSTAASIMLAPGLGTSLYLVLRPGLPSTESKKSDLVQ